MTFFFELPMWHILFLIVVGGLIIRGIFRFIHNTARIRQLKVELVEMQQTSDKLFEAAKHHEQRLADEMAEVEMLYHLIKNKPKSDQADTTDDSTQSH